MSSRLSNPVAGAANDAGLDGDRFWRDPAGAAWQDLRGRLGMGSSDQGPSQTQQAYERLTREMWANYVTNFIPYEDRLIDYASNPEQITDAQDEASQFVEDSFNAQRGATDRRLRGLGLTLDADEQKAADRSFGLSKALADVTAQNVARDQVVNRQQQILGNPAPTAGSVR